MSYFHQVSLHMGSVDLDNTLVFLDGKITFWDSIKPSTPVYYIPSMKLVLSTGIAEVGKINISVCRYAALPSECGAPDSAAPPPPPLCADNDASCWQLSLEGECRSIMSYQLLHLVKY